jgi:hypothetical protein
MVMVMVIAAVFPLCSAAETKGPLHWRTCGERGKKKEERRKKKEERRKK